MNNASLSITNPLWNKQQKHPYYLVLLAAVCSILSYPPADLGWLAWIAFVPLIAVVTDARRPLKAVGLGYLYGLIFWGGTTLWVGQTVVNWAHTLLGWMAWIGLTIIESGWFGLFGLMAWQASRRCSGIGRALLLAAVWIAMEWMRSQGSLAMPWDLAGYTQYRLLAVTQIADATGVYGVGFAVFLVNATFATALCAGNSKRLMMRLFAVSSAILTVVIIYGCCSLRRSFDGSPYRVALVQVNPMLNAEPSPNPEVIARMRHSLLADYRDTMQQIHPGTVDLTVLPESAAPTDAINEDDERTAFAEMARDSNAYLLLGTGYRDQEDNDYNSAALFAPNGMLADRYDKRQLVPYGEWVPGRSLLAPLKNTFQWNDRDTKAGTQDKVVQAGSARIGVLICYESVFPALSRRSVALGANLLVSISNDAWSNGDTEPRQHAAMTAFRAIETRRSVVSSTTTGVTGYISPIGEIKSLPTGGNGLLLCTVKLGSGESPYVQYGDWFAYLCLAVVVAALIGSVLRHHE